MTLIPLPLYSGRLARLECGHWLPYVSFALTASPSHNWCERCECRGLVTALMERAP